MSARHHTAFYAGRTIIMDHVAPDREFREACLKIVHSGFDGHIETPDGKKIEVCQGSKLAQQAKQLAQLEMILCQ